MQVDKIHEVVDTSTSQRVVTRVYRCRRKEDAAAVAHGVGGGMSVAVALIDGKASNVATPT